MKRLLKYISFLLLLVFFLFLVMVAYTHFSTQMDSGLFDGQPCKAPCWQNLTPGQSTSSDVDQFFDSLSKTNWPIRDIRTKKYGCKSILMMDRFGLGVVEFYIENSNLTFIHSTHGYIANLGQVVDHFGLPEYLEANVVIGAEGEGYIAVPHNLLLT